MYILGLNAGHNATACLLKNGKIVGCVSEERFSRIKNHSGMPLHSISYLLEDSKISISDIDLIVLDNNLKKDPYFSKKFLDAYTKKPLKKRVLSKLGYRYPNLFKRYFNVKGEMAGSKESKSPMEVKRKISSILKFPIEKIEIVNHHLAHALSCCFNVSKKEKTLIFTLDGEGDGLCATVNIFDGKDWKVISKSDKTASLGYLYSIVTIFLGMKPLQHEFKVMGMAPYAKEHNIDKIYNKFDKLFWIDEQLRFQSKFNAPFLDHFFKEKMKFERFDNICGAVQKLVEELACEWVKRGIEKTGIRNIALSGGVFMNVKVNMKIAQLEGVKKLFIMPSCGDESNALGSCFYGYLLYCKRNNVAFSPKPIEDLYLGPEYDDKYIEELIKDKNLKNKYIIKKPKNINSEIAKLLSKEKIVARCSGRSEWGARTLGNRSILANPKSKDTIKILNETIKDRDFWMPFTPSMLDKDEKKYIKNPKNIPAPYMILTFESKEKAKEDLPAAMHPYDSTIRPQIVYKDWNPDYYEIISQFKKFTGVGAILNTSFNLHGSPMS
ncbi:MAG: hypothetical protein IIA87_00020 [Nanoarchaeota archaeon]|nr:hypothetical protein [Nanoarchaeota archaeon]